MKFSDLQCILLSGAAQRLDGGLTLKTLLSFAQFEREVTAERIRDKIAAPALHFFPPS